MPHGDGSLIVERRSHIVANATTFPRLVAILCQPTSLSFYFRWTELPQRCTGAFGSGWLTLLLHRYLSSYSHMVQV